MSIKALQQINAKQQALEQGLKQMQTEKMRGIEAKADAFLTASDPIGFIGKLASEAPEEIAPVVNAARRKKKEVMQAQAPQQETITTAGIRETLAPQQPQQLPPNPRQMAVASLPMRPDMFKAGGGIVAFSGRQGSFVDALNRQFETANPYMVPFEKSGSFKDFYRDMFGVPRYKGKQDISRDPSMLRQIAPFLTSEELDKELIEEERSAGFRKTDQSEQITKQELDRRIAEQDSRDPFRDQRALDALRKIRPPEEVKAEAEAEAEAKQPIVPETATEAAIGEAGVDTKPISVEDAFAQAKSIFSPKNVAKDGAISTEIEAPEDYNTRVINIMKKAGVDFDNSAQQAALEKEKAALKGDKKEAVYMSLLELGFAIMGGKDPNAIANIGKAGMQVAPALAKRIQATKDARRKVLDSELRLAELKNKRAEGVARITADMITNAENQAQQNKRTEMQVVGNLTRQIMGDKNAMEVAKVRARGTVKAQEIAASVKSLSRADLAIRYANADESERKILAEAIRLAYPETGAQMLKQFASTLANKKGDTVSKAQITKDLEGLGVTLDNTDR